MKDGGKQISRLKTGLAGAYGNVDARSGLTAGSLPAGLFLAGIGTRCNH